MEGVLQLFATTVSLFLWVVYVAMFLRMVLSFLPIADDNPFLLFTVMLTEPLIMPIRFLLSRFAFVEESPFDICFTVTFFILAFLRLVLPVLP